MIDSDYSIVRGEDARYGVFYAKDDNGNELTMDSNPITLRFEEDLKKIQKERK